MLNRPFPVKLESVLVGPTNLLNKLIVVSMIVVGLSCLHSTQSNLNAQTASKNSNSDQAVIEAILAKQTKAWNEGDLEKFMQTYWKSDKLTFSSGGKTTYGWQPTLDNYKKSYPTREKMGRLHFDGLEISMISTDSALVLGKWHLRMADNTNLEGNFSLVVKKIDSTWKIIHDHSSTLEPDGKQPKIDD